MKAHRSILGLLVIVAACLSLGMGNLGSKDTAQEAPLAEKEVTAVLTDLKGLTLTLSRFSINGQAFVTGNLGAGRLTVPFGRIRVMTFSPAPKGLQMTAELNDRSQVILIMEKGQTAYGMIAAGAYRIPLEQVQRIEIKEVADRSK
jgi:hypothetical protein